jgi:hypothetical protein
MALNFPNIVPENNLRLPDALIIKHGPAPLLARFVLEGDKVARSLGIRLRLRHDFDELLYLNKQEVARGNWYRMMHLFNPERTTLSPEDSYWISGENDAGEIVVTQAGRVYDWSHSNLAQEARMLLYGGCEEGQRCEVTATDAPQIRGTVFFGGSVWVRPDYRRRHLSCLLPRLGRAYAVARWPVDWGISLVKSDIVEKGIAAGYGYKHQSAWVRYPGSPWGDLDLVLVSLTAHEAYDDFAHFLMTELLGDVSADKELSAALPSTVLDHDVMSVEPAEVFQGSSNRS